MGRGILGGIFAAERQQLLKILCSADRVDIVVAGRRQGEKIFRLGRRVVDGPSLFERHDAILFPMNDQQRHVEFCDAGDVIESVG